MDCPSVRADLSEDGEYLAVSNLVIGFYLYDLASGDIVRAFGHDVGERRATPVRFIESDGALVGGTTTGQMNIWDTSSGQQAQTLSHNGPDVLSHTVYDSLNLYYRAQDRPCL